MLFRSLKKFGVSSALARFWILDPKKITLERNIPPVQFESLPKSADLVQKLRTTGSFESIQKQVDRKWIRDIRGEDGTDYTTYIVFALAFALAGEWKIALTLANTAYNIGFYARDEDPSSSIKGDEAAYLCAVFSRLSAKNMDDLSAHRFWINKAHKLQIMKPIRASLKGKDLSIECPRFAAERLALDLTIRLFRQFSKLDQRALKFSFPKDKPLKVAGQELLQLLPTMINEEDPYICKYVKEQIIINFLQVQMLAYGNDGHEAINIEDCNKLINILMGETFKDTQPSTISEARVSKLIKAVLICSSALFAPSVMGWDKDSVRKELIRILEEQCATSDTMPYDENRFYYYMELVKKQYSVHM